MQAEAAFAEVLEMSGKDSQKKLRDALALLQNVQVHARMAGVISVDEEAREVSGKNLEFVLLNWNIAQLLSRCILETDGSREAFEASIIARKSYVSRAILSIEAFIVQLQQLRLISTEDEKMLHFDPANASVRRERKISLFRKIKAANEQLEQSKARHERLVQMRSAPKIWSGSSSSRAAAAADDDGDDDWEEEGDTEEAHRTFVLAKLHLSMLEAMDSYSGLKDEMELLDSRPTEVLGSSATEQKTHAHGCSGGKATMSILHLDKDRVRAAAFMPTNLPTMSIEEWAKVESECQCEREKRAQAVAKETKEMEARLTKAEKEEIERMKKSLWDDWKDDNPAGSGNTGANLG